MEIKRPFVDWSMKSPLFPNHMAFIIGPRQVGKSTSALAFLKKKKKTIDGYFNWDSEKTIRRFRQNPYFFESLQEARKKNLIVFDEIHKRRKWKAYLKGVFDTYREFFNSSLPEVAG
jgi:uncharacterized protein